MRKLTIALLSIAILTGTAAALATTAYAGDISPEATAIARKYEAAVSARDAHAIAMLYASDGVVVSQTGKIISGRENIEKTYIGTFKNGPFGVVDTLDETHVTSDGGWGAGHATQDFNGRKVPVHFLTVYTRENGALKIRAIGVGVNTPTSK
jgi:ketosteroid isomerase-like protein